MVFSKVRPALVGYFQSDLNTPLPERKSATQAALLYVAMGHGRGQVGAQAFEFNEGCFIAYGCGEGARLEPAPGRKLGFYYLYLEASSQCADVSLVWPWDLSLPSLPQTAVPSPCVPGVYSPEIAQQYRRLQIECARARVCGGLAAKAHLALLGVAFARALARTARRRSPSARLPESSQTRGETLPEAVARVVDFVHAHLDKDLTLGELSRIARYSERRLVQLFRKSFDLSPMAFVRELRIREAQRLLDLGALSIKEVARQLNFADPQHFSRVFRRATGISPTQYIAGEAPIRQRASSYYAAPGRGLGLRRESGYRLRDSSRGRFEHAGGQDRFPSA